MVFVGIVGFCCFGVCALGVWLGLGSFWLVVLGVSVVLFGALGMGSWWGVDCEEGGAFECVCACLCVVLLYVFHCCVLWRC